MRNKGITIQVGWAGRLRWAMPPLGADFISFLIGRGAAVSDVPSFVVMACPHCQGRVRVPTSALGSQRKCPCCGGTVKVPRQIPTSAATAPAAPAKAATTGTAAAPADADGGQRTVDRSHARDEFGLVCRLCGSRLYARPDQIGQTIQCPDCYAANEVLDPELLVERKTFQADEDYDLRLAEDNDVSLPQGDSYRVQCRVCESSVYCRPDQQGRPTICPDCSSVIIVPPPPPPKKKIELTGADADIEVAPTFDLPVQKTNADKLLAAAQAKVAEQERNKPKPPKRPFRDGIWGFPFLPRVLPGWVAMAALGAGILALASQAIELAMEQSLASVLGLILFMPMGMLLITWILLAAHIYLSIVYWTALGYPTIQDFGAVEPMEWLRKAFFLINALAVSCFPGLIVRMVVPFAALELAVTLVIIFFMFPYMLLCMLDEETPVTVHSAYIWRTTREVRWAWRKFYQTALLVVLPTVALHVVAAKFAQSRATTWPVYGAVIYSMCAGVWYFRLLGRLAWILDEYHATLPVEDDDSPSQKPSWLDPSRADHPAGV